MQKDRQVYGGRTPVPFDPADPTAWAMILARKICAEVYAENRTCYGVSKRSILDTSGWLFSTGNGYSFSRSSQKE